MKEEISKEESCATEQIIKVKKKKQIFDKLLKRKFENFSLFHN